MKRILNFSMAVLMLCTVFALLSTTGNVVMAASVTVSVGIFSALVHSGVFKGVAFDGLVLPDFTDKTAEEVDEIIKELKFEEQTAEQIIEMEPTERIKYAENKANYQMHLQAKATKEQIEALKAELNDEEDEATKKSREDVIKSIEERLQKSLEASDKAVMLIASLNEKGGKGEEAKSDLQEFIEKRIAGLKDETIKMGGPMEEVVIKAAALMTTANIIPNATDGFNQLFGNAIDPIIHHVPKREPFILELVNTQMTPGTENHWFVQRINEEGDAAFIGEGDAKPLIDGEYKEFKAVVKEVAEFWKFSQKLLLHTSSVVADFRTHAEELIELQIDSGVLDGDGVGDNLEGVTVAASAFVVPGELANFYPAANIFDVIMATAVSIRLNNFNGPLTAVLNPVWKAKMQGIKDANNRYIMPSFVAPDGSMVGEVRVVFNNGMGDADILLGELKKFQTRISENIMYAEGWIDDDFRKNLVSRRLAAFLATYFPSNYAGAIIFDDIATIELAIEDTTT